MNGNIVNILCVGNVDQILAPIAGIEYTGDINAPYDVVAIFPGADVNGLYENMFRQKKVFSPVINLTGSQLKRQDFAFDEFSEQNWLNVKTNMMGLLSKIAALPDMASSPDYTLLACLGLSYTRGVDITATWNSSISEYVEYQLLSGISSQRDHLEEMLVMGLLTASAFDKVHICNACQSSRLNVREECSKCSSSHLNEHSLIHHYRCAHQAVGEEFEADNKLICPKCNHELRHYGVDYDRSGNVLQCEECSEITTEPAIGFVCTDCGEHSSGDTITVRNWNHYSLTPSGQNTLITGKLPKRVFSSVFKHLKGVYNKHDFIALSLFSREGSIRYKRNLSAFKVDIVGLQKMRNEMGNQELNRTLAMLAEVVSEVVRTTDAVTIEEDELFILMPETSSDAARISFARIDKRIKGTISYPVELRYVEFDFLEEPQSFIGEMK